MVGIVVALYSEAKYLLEKVDNLTEFKIADKRAFSFKLADKDVVLAISGIGKVSAGLTTQLLIDKYSPDYILNFGTCGGMNTSVEILKYYTVDKCCQFDFDLRQLDNVPLGYIQEYDRVFFNNSTKGLEFLQTSSLASADRFTNDLCDINAINDLGCSLRDMEGGAIAQVCTSNNVPLYMIKGITDIFNNGTAQEQFYQNLQTVTKGFPKIIEKAIREINK